MGIGIYDLQGLGHVHQPVPLQVRQQQLGQGQGVHVIIGQDLLQHLLALEGQEIHVEAHIIAHHHIAA